jgi:hypothetical protein
VFTELLPGNGPAISIHLASLHSNGSTRHNIKRTNFASRLMEVTDERSEGGLFVS